jgi:hypothetical protein
MNVLHTHSRHVTQNHGQPCRLRSDMVRLATARLPVIMPVPELCTQPPPAQVSSHCVTGCGGTRIGIRRASVIT